MGKKREATAGNNAAQELLNERKRRFIEGDRTLWIIFTVLLVISILVV